VIINPQGGGTGEGNYYDEWYKALEQEDCYKLFGFDSASAAKTALQDELKLWVDMGTTAGRWQVNADGSFTLLSYGFQVGEYVPGVGIFMNNNPVLWDLHKVPIQDPNGNIVFRDALAAFARREGLRANSMTGALYRAIYGLHEFGHATGKFPKDGQDMTLNQAHTREVVQKCFSGLLKKSQRSRR
jgi:hypothetical protein